jgi:hypothetical protein
LAASEDRKSAWRQGSVIASDVALALNIFAPDEAETKIGIVISHDCDLVQPVGVEPHVEVIAAQKVVSSDGNFTHAKNPRKLVVTLKQNGADVHCLLCAQDKVKVQKDALMAGALDPSIVMPADTKTVLQKWLAARYRRTALPDEFDRRLKNTGLQKQLATILEPAGDTVIALFFLTDDDEKGAEELYDIIVYVLYHSGQDPVAANTVAKGISEKVAAAFKAKCKSGANWTHFELVECEPVSDEAMTVAMERQLKKWNGDYLSLRAIPFGKTTD